MSASSSEDDRFAAAAALAESSSDDEQAAAEEEEKSKSKGAKKAKKSKSKKKKKKTAAELTSDKLAEFEETAKRRGVVYLARIPPGCNPTMVREKLSMHGEIGRVFLVPEDEARRKARIKNGGRGNRRFREGWVEFSRKKIARNVAELLNATRFSGRKGDAHYDDLWSIKFLKHFKWEHLTEKMAYEASVREQRVKAQVAQGRRETAAFLENVMHSSKLKAKRAAKAARAEEAGGEAGGSGGGGQQQQDTRRRHFRQQAPMESGDGGRGASESFLQSISGQGGGGGGKRKHEEADPSPQQGKRKGKKAKA